MDRIQEKKRKEDINMANSPAHSAGGKEARRRQGGQVQGNDA